MKLISQLGMEDEILATPLTSLPVEELSGNEFFQDISVSAEETVAAAKESADLLAAIMFPEVYKYAFPPVYLSVWSWLLSYTHKSRDFSQLALGLPRGFGKTLFLKLYVLYCILFSQKRFILVICETQSKANNILADVMDALNEQNAQQLFGDWKLGIETDRQDLKKFGFRGRSIVLMAAGADTSIRGITLKNLRPDIMLFDDVQSRECAESQTQTNKLEREFVGTIMKAKSPHGCLFIFVANMYPTKWSLLRKLKYNPEWIKFIAGGILSDGTSLWEELQPIAQLISEFKNDLAMGRPEIFYSEVLNDENASANFLVDFSLIPALPFQEGDIPGGNFVVIDPASGKLGSDDVAIGYFEVYEGLPVLRQLKNGRFSPGDTIRHALEFCLTNNCRLVAVESVAYQSTLNYWFKFICEQKGIYGIEAVEVYPGMNSKNSRILSMFKGLMAGEVFVDTSVRPQVHLQIQQFNPLKTDNQDDILDLLTYANKVMELYAEYIQITSVLLTGEYDSIQILPPQLTSPF